MIKQETPVVTTRNTFVQKAQQKVLHRLVQAVLRENLADYYFVQEGKALLAVLPNSQFEKILIPIASSDQLNHVEIVGEIEYQTEKGIKKITHPIEFLKHMNFDKAQFEAEIDNSVWNYALAFEAEERRKSELPLQGDTFSFLKEKQKANPSFSPLVFGEQWVIEGHTLHPCSKTRMGLTEEEFFRFSPENGALLDVIPLAIHKDYACMAAMDESSMTTILLEEYPHVKKSFTNELPGCGKDYELIPVHPWQFEHTIKHFFKKEIDENIIVPLIDSVIPASALLSFRSLAPVGRKDLHHFKTAVDVQMTSAKRIVSPASVKNGPVISKVLKEIQLQDPVVGNAYKFLAEQAGGHFLPLRRENRSFLMKNLSAFLRENPEKHLNHDEIAVPAAFLISRSPFSDKLVLHELIDQYTRINELDKKIGAKMFFHTYAGQLLPGLLQLMAKYGISLEAHLQNTIAVFKHGWPVRFLFRDNGGIRIKEDRFHEHFPEATIDNSTNLLTNNNKDLTNIFSHALLHNHLGEMIYMLSKEIDMDEKVLWEPVRRHVHSTFTKMKGQNKDKETLEALENELCGPHAPLKALVRMRLDDQCSENIYSLMPNPLAYEKGEWKI